MGATPWSPRGGYAPGCRDVSRGHGHVLQLIFGCTTFQPGGPPGGFSGVQGTFCVAAWGFCFAL